MSLCRRLLRIFVDAVQQRHEQLSCQRSRDTPASSAHHQWHWHSCYPSCHNHRQCWYKTDVDTAWLATQSLHVSTVLLLNLSTCSCHLMKHALQLNSSPCRQVWRWSRWKARWLQLMFSLCRQSNVINKDRNTRKEQKSHYDKKNQPQFGSLNIVTRLCIVPKAAHQLLSNKTKSLGYIVMK